MSDILKGIPVSSGIATGKAFILSPEKVEINKINIEPSQIRDELNRFEKAIEVGKAQIEEVKNRIARDMGKKYSMLFNAHKMMLDDCLFKDEVISMIRFSRVNAEYAIEKVINKLLKTFGIVEDQYFEERHSDIFHIGFRIIRILQGFESVGFNNLPEDVIIIAHDLSPVEMTELHKKSILGFITEIGSKTSHTAILARAFQIPAVVGVEQITKRVKGGESIVIDAYEGLVIINSDKNQRLEYARKRKKYIHIEEKLSRLSLYPAETKDGYRIRLSANLELPAEVKSALTHGADSIGLYRTEFLFL
ncbi:phosphoenolpyruvate--protein phosphotransferase, partial [bacterium]|nr:phosphoenolpyruvate--protein phosphotransferase [bacterium]